MGLAFNGDTISGYRYNAISGLQYARKKCRTIAGKRLMVKENNGIHATQIVQQIPR